MKIFIFENIDKKNISQRHIDIMRSLSEWVPEELPIETVENESFLSDFDIMQNVIVAHYSDVKICCPSMTYFSNALVIFHTFSWELPNFFQDEDVKRINNYHNRYCCPSKLLIENIASFFKSYYSKTPNPYYKLIGFNPDLEELLSQRLESDRSGKKHENYDADFVKIKNILLIPKS